jgi:signal transduction histidine kinase
VPLPEFIRDTTFRWAVTVAGVFALCTLLMFGFVLYASVRFTTNDIDALISGALDRIVRTDNPVAVAQGVEEHLQEDPRRTKLAALFAPDGSRVAGNIQSLPPDLRSDAGPQFVVLTRTDAMGSERRTFRATAHRMPNGGTVVVARDVSELSRLVEIVRDALTVGFIPAFALSLAAGFLLSLRAQRRIRLVNAKVQRIMAGELRERLPTRGSNDPFDKLAVSVNGMLDEIEGLVNSIAGVGDDIAHDLRTPLTRVRVCLERGREDESPAELRKTIDQAIVRLDQSLAIITALLRISEIEQTRRVAVFGSVDLAGLLREVAEFYEPIAEDKKISFTVDAGEHLHVHGDRDLLFEAVANLVDNAVKFTPEGGHVAVALRASGAEAVVSISDDGPGIPNDETELVTRRFYRSDKSRTEPGYGLGLSLVNAIVKLHGFRMKFSKAPGCVAEIAGPLQAEPLRA